MSSAAAERSLASPRSNATMPSITGRTSAGGGGSPGGRGRCFARVRISPHETRAGPRLARLRQLHAGDAARAPCDAAWADIGVEERKAVFRHGGSILAAAVTA